MPSQQFSFFYFIILTPPNNVHGKIIIVILDGDRGESFKINLIDDIKQTTMAFYLMTITKLKDWFIVVYSKKDKLNFWG